MRKNTYDKPHALGFFLACLVVLCLFVGAADAQAAEISPVENADTPVGQTDPSTATVSGNDTSPGTGQPTDPALSVVNWNITATTVRYGQPLKTSTLSGKPVDALGNPVKGTFAWKEPEKIMMTVGAVSTEVLFTPEIVDENGRIQQQAPRSVTFWVTVEKGEPSISWCTVKCKEAIYDGDTPGEVTELQGGAAVYTVAVADKTAEKQGAVSGSQKTVPENQKAVSGNQKTVSGKFVWKNSAQKLETGMQVCELMFVPKDEDLYERVSTQVELKVLPRPVDLQLELSEKVVRAGDEVLLTASIEKTQKLQKIDGKLCFYENGKVIGEKKLTESDAGWQAAFAWKAEAAGEHKLSVEYIPADDHTAKERSEEKTVTVVGPLTALLTEELQTGREGKTYKAQLETDASGRFAMRFELKERYLPDGLTLDENDGTISGIPEEAGEFTFAVAVSEKDVTVSRQYRLTIKEKLTFSVRCSDIRYGEKLTVVTEVSPKAEFRCSYTFEGTGKTDYAKSDVPPTEPGTYRVKVEIEEPADYAGQELYQEFAIKKAIPKLTVTADPAELKDGNDCTLSIRLQNPADPHLTAQLPTKISVSFEQDVEIRQALEGKDGSYTLVFQRKEAQQIVKIRCTVLVEENSCYEGVDMQKDIAVVKKEVPRTEEPEKEQSPKPSSQNKGEEEPKTESEPEAVKKTPEEVEAEFWQDVIFRIYKAQEKGETVTINAKGHKSLPDKVLDALRKHDKVTLALVWEGDMIVIPAGKAVDYDKEHKTWTLEELSRRYPLSATESSVQAAQPTPPAATQEPTQNVQQASEASQTGTAPVQSGSGQGDGKADVEQTEAAESETGETESAEKQQDFTEVLKLPETIPAMEEVQEGSAIDWFLVAAGVCAVCGVVVVALAIAAMAKGKKRNGE